MNETMNLVIMKFIISIVFGISALVCSLLLIYFAPNLWYFVRRKFSNQPVVGRPPTKKPRELWILFWVVVGTMILTSAVGSSLPDAISAPTLASLMPTETSTSTYLSVVTETLTLTPTGNLHSTETRTPIGLETFGGLTSDCIPDLYWNTLDPKIIPDANECLPVSSWGLYAGDRELTILLDPQDVRESIVKTIFLPISGNVEISFDVTLEDIKDGSDPNAPPLFSVGICNPDKIKTSHNFISYNYPGDGSVGWGILNNDESRFQQYNLYTLNTPQSFVIKIDSFDLLIEDSKTENYIWTNPKVSPGDLQAFCIRYQMPTLGTLKVSISDLSIVEK